MAIETKQVEYAKEIDDVMNLLVQIVTVLKEKGQVTSLVDELIVAIDGVDQVDDELSENMQVALQTIGAQVGNLTAALLKKKPVQVPSEA